MRIFKNNTLPLKIRKSLNTEQEVIELSNNRNVFYDKETDFSYLNVDNTSSAIFINPTTLILPETTVRSGELLLIDRDVVANGDIVVESGGEIRII